MTQQKHYPQHIDLEPVLHAQGVVRLPGSKSISNRTLLLAALAEALAEQVRPGQDVNSDGPKALLRANTEAAQAAGVFGVPAFGVDGKLFWGLDGLPMLRAYLDGDAWFDGPAWDAVSQLPSGLPGKR